MSGLVMAGAMGLTPVRTGLVVTAGLGMSLMRTGLSMAHAGLAVMTGMAGLNLMRAGMAGMMGRMSRALGERHRSAKQRQNKELLHIRVVCWFVVGFGGIG